MSATESTANSLPIDETIVQLEKVYKAVTGKEAPDGETAYAPIPAEKDPARHVEDQLGRLLGMLADPGPAEAPAWSPPMSVWEDDNELRLYVDLPGVVRGGVEVSVRGGLLEVSGARPSSPGSESSLRLSERPFGPFRRSIVLPPAARRAEPQASLRDGVLEIRIRKEPDRVGTTKAVPVN